MKTKIEREVRSAAITRALREDPTMPEDALDVSDNDSWIPCLKCGSELTQERKAFFVCVNCGQEFIGDEEDMRK
ncbi:MAG: hypothetical protein FVQ78_09985 [Solirubrobacterales bacterium]|nr:hypothetical protein [Solirubrobacterales bacterium]